MKKEPLIITLFMWFIAGPILLVAMCVIFPLWLVIKKLTGYDMFDF